MSTNCTPNTPYDGPGPTPISDDYQWWLKSHSDFTAQRELNSIEKATSASSDEIDFETLKSCSFFGLGCGTGERCARIFMSNTPLEYNELCIMGNHCGKTFETKEYGDIGTLCLELDEVEEENGDEEEMASKLMVVT